MGKATSNNGSTARYLINLPELDYYILDALIKCGTGRLGTEGIREYYERHHLRAPTKAAFSQAISRLKSKGIIHAERHERLWIEFKSEKIGKLMTRAIISCIEASEGIGGET